MDTYATYMMGEGRESEPAKPSSLERAGSARTPTFVAEKSDTKFALTPEEEAHLNNLLLWQEQSAKSVIMIGGTGEAPNNALTKSHEI
jgi:hypothetical protein